MTKQSTITVATIMGVVALGILLVYAQPNKNNEQSDAVAPSVKNVLSTDKTTYDFGTISMKNGTVRTTFKIKNPQSGEVTLSKLYTSCMCTEAVLKLGGSVEGPFGMQGHGLLPTFNRKLQPNEEAEIEVAFDPNAHGPAGIGKVERTVTLEGPQGELVSVGIKANVIP